MSSNLEQIYTNPLMFPIAVFWIWMLIDAIRRREWIWAVFIFFFFLSAVFYFFLVFRPARAVEGRSRFELPGASTRKRIRELETQIHHLDKAHHRAELGGIYLRQGKFDKAESYFQSALERDPEDIDIHASYGRCLLAQGRPREAAAELERVVAADPEHDYGQSMLILGQARHAAGETVGAIEAWTRVLECHSYTEARLGLAEAYVDGGQLDEARTQLNQLLSDEEHSPAFQQKRDRVHARKARQLLNRIRA